MYFYPGESVTYLSIEASEGEGPGPFINRWSPWRAGEEGLSGRNALLLWDRQPGEWALGIAKGTGGPLQELWSKWDQGGKPGPQADLYPNPITYKCVGKGMAALALTCICEQGMLTPALWCYDRVQGDTIHPCHL